MAPNVPVYPLFDPEHPITGMNSYTEAIAIGPTRFSQLSNLRFDKIVPYCRNGTGTGSSTIRSSSTFRGCVAVKFTTIAAGAPYLMCAYEDNAGAVDTRVYDSTSGTFLERTHAVSQYPASRLSVSGSADGTVAFCPTTMIDPSPYVAPFRPTAVGLTLIQNGIDTPRIQPQSAAAVEVLNTIVPPTNDQFASQPTFPAFLKVKDHAETTFANTGGTILFTDGSTNPNNYIVWTATNPTNGHTSLVTMSTAFALGTSGGVLSSQQLAFLVDATAASFTAWDSIKIEIHDGTTYATVYDGTSTIYPGPIVQPMDPLGKKYVIAFSLSHLTGTTAPNLSTINRLRFTWSGSSVAASTFVLNLYGVWGTGLVPGNASHILSYQNSFTRAESRGLVVNNINPTLCKSIGCADSLNSLDISNIPFVYYNYILSFPNVSAADLANGVDTVYIYRRDFGDPDWYFVSSYVMASYSGSWALTTGAAYGLVNSTDSTFNKVYAVNAPDPNTIPLPLGKAMIAANNRVYVAAKQTGFSRLYISDYKFPLRYRETSRLLDDGSFDPTSGTTHMFPGENLQGFCTVATGFAGISTVYVFTDRRIYAIGQDVNRLQVVADVGTRSPWSIVQHNGVIYFLDRNRTWRRLAGGRIDDLSSRLTRDRWDALPGTTWTTNRQVFVSAEWFDNKLYVGYTPAGQTTNTKIMIWDERDEVWYEDVLTSPFTAEGLIVWENATVDGLYGFSSDGKMYQHDKPGQTTDFTNNIPITLTTGEFRIGPWQRFTVRRVGGVMTDLNSGTLTVSRYYYPGSATPSTSTYNLDASTDRSFRWDGAQTLHDTSGKSAKVSITGNVTSGFKIYELKCEVDPLDGGADTA